MAVIIVEHSLYIAESPWHGIYNVKRSFYTLRNTVCFRILFHTTPYPKMGNPTFQYLGRLGRRDEKKVKIRWKLMCDHNVLLRWVNPTYSQYLQSPTRFCARAPPPTRHPADRVERDAVGRFLNRPPHPLRHANNQRWSILNTNMEYHLKKASKDSPDSRDSRLDHI